MSSVVFNVVIQSADYASRMMLFHLRLGELVESTQLPRELQCLGLAMGNTSQHTLFDNAVVRA